MTSTLVPDQITRVSAPDLTRDLDLLDDEVAKLLDFTHEIKRAPGRYGQALGGKSIAVLFEKPSLRTRLTFELAMQQLGGSVVSAEGPIGTREPLKDVARNLDRWVNAIVARTFSQDTIEELARWSAVPVINALSDRFHPCQALADVFTLSERFGELRGLRLAFVGDGNNVAHSLMLTSLRLGINFSIATPRGYQPDPDVVARATHELAVTDLTPELPRIRAPLTILYASPDPSLGPTADGVYREAYAGDPAAHLARIDGSGHMIMADQPRRFAEELRKFLAAD